MNITDLILENLVSVFGLKIFIYFDAGDPGSSQPWIRDKHTGTATVIKT
jgi:hypothetical protein